MKYENIDDMIDSVYTEQDPDFKPAVVEDAEDDVMDSETVCYDDQGEATEDPDKVDYIVHTEVIKIYRTFTFTRK